MGALRSISKWSIISFLISQPFFNLPTFAAGFQLHEFSPSLQGSAQAGAGAATNDVSSLFVNPATLSTLIDNQVYFGGSEILPHFRMFDGHAIHRVNVPGLPPSNITATVLGVNSQHSISKSAFVPTGYFGYRINDKLVAGIGLLAPFGLTTKYFGDSVLRFVADYTGLKTINIVPSFSYTLNDQWAFGAGFQAQYLRTRFTGFNGPYTGVGIVDALIAAEHPSNLHASGWGYGYTLGTLFTPFPCTRIGLGYRSQISERLTGHGHQFIAPGSLQAAPSTSFLFNADSPLSIRLKTPGILTLSAAQDIYDWTVKATAQVNFWNTFNKVIVLMPNAFVTNFTVNTKWRNAWFLALGADYRITPCWTARAGFAWDQTPTVSRFREPRIPDADRFWLNLGASYLVLKCLAIDAAYSHIFALNTRVSFTQATGTNASSFVPLEVNTVRAKFRGSADIVGLAVRYSF